jgi:putative glutamine amidotransferase
MKNVSPRIALPASVFANSQHQLCGVNNIVIKLLSGLGAIPVLIPECNSDSIQRITELCDGLLLPSGPDISPSLYHASSKVNYSDSVGKTGTRFLRPSAYQSKIDFDLFERDMTQSFFKMEKPIIGICRGMQMINVALGGTLHQEIPISNICHEMHQDNWIPYHKLLINSNSRMCDIMETKQSTISSLHHQSVDKLGLNLIASAFSEDAVVEALESKNHDFVIGLQGHPEKMTDNFPEFHKLFAEFVNICRRSNV